VETPDEQPQNQPRRFYRILSGHEPTRSDFLSDHVRGKDRPSNPARVRYWEGFSVFETLAQARGIIEANKVRAGEKGLEWEEKFIVEVTIQPDSPITYERWGRNEGHYTIWGTADECLACVTGIFPATPHEGG
jgi:hypothetical protein